MTHARHPVRPAGGIDTDHEARRLTAQGIRRPLPEALEGALQLGLGGFRFSQTLTVFLDHLFLGAGQEVGIAELLHDVNDVASCPAISLTRRVFRQQGQ